MKDHMKQKFQQWYAAEVQQKLKTTPVNEIQVDVSLSAIKNPGLFLDGKRWQGGQKLQLTASGNLQY